MEKKLTQSREGVKGQLPLAESRGSASGGVWGNAPTVPRQTYSKEAANKGAGSEASLPVTKKPSKYSSSNMGGDRRRSPEGDRKALWKHGNDQYGSADKSECLKKQHIIASRGFRACGRESGALRSPPTPLRSAHPCGLIFIVSWVKWRCPPSAPQSFPHADAPDSQTAPPAPGTAARRPSARQIG